MTDLRFVFDTNVIISALLSKASVSRQAFDKAQEIGKVIFSPATLAELREVLHREKFNRYLPESDRLQFLSLVVYKGLFIKVHESIDECRDPKDNKFLELAVSGDTECIVSGDDDLLVLHPFRNIPIVTPRDFINQSWQPQH